MAADPSKKDVKEYFQLLSQVRQDQSLSVTDGLCSFVDLLSERLKQGKLGSVQQGLTSLKVIFESLRPTFDQKDQKFEQDHRELMALAAGSDLPVADALISEDLRYLDRH
jgi:hypothetical protein